MNEFATNECDPTDVPIQAEAPTPAPDARGADIHARHWLALATQEASYALFYEPGSDSAKRSIREFLRAARNVRNAAERAGWL